jgi:hypothetical protein
MTALTFHHPSALLWALLAVPLAMLYLRRVRPATRAIGTGFLWQQVLGHPATARWLLWRGPVSLGLLLLILLLLVLALADPSLRPARRTVLVIDNSASMNATDASPTRLDQARQWADRWAGTLATHDEAAILAAGDGVAACCGWSRRPEVLRAAIGGVKATDGRSLVRQAVSLARQLLAGDPRGRILVLSDGSFPGVAELARSGDVQWVSFGGRGDNVGITRLEARRSFSSPLGCQVFVEVTNYCDKPVACPLQLFWDDAPLAGKRGQSPFAVTNLRSVPAQRVLRTNGDSPVFSATVEIPVGGQWRQVFQTTRSEGGRLAARLDHPDCYLADNRATADMPPCRRFRVVLEGDKNVYLEKAMAANPRVAFDSDETRPAQEPLQNRSAATGENAHPTAAVGWAFLPDGDARGPETAPKFSASQTAASLGDGTTAVHVIYGPLPKTLPAGPLVVLRPEGPCDLWQSGEAIAEPVVARQAEELPLLRDVRLAGIRLAVARKLLLRPNAEPLAQPLAWAADGSPLGYAIARPEGRVLVLSGSLEGSEWPQRTAFPILLANALDWVATGSEGNALGGVPQPAFAPDIRILQELAGKTISPTDREFPLWIGLVGLACLLLTVEWSLYHRRWTC